MQNICFLNTTQFWGGGEKIHFDYGLKFKERGYKVFFAASGTDQLFAKTEALGFKPFDITLKNLSFLNPFKYYRLYKFYKRNKIDTIIISTSHDSKVGSIAAKLAGVKRIVLYRALAAPVKNRVSNRYIYRKAFTHLIANSQETKRTMLMNMDSIDKDDVHIIYQGLDFDEMSTQPIQKLDFPKDKIIIGNAGRLTKQKGQHLLIDIAQILKNKGLNFQIVIAGTGELEQELRSMIDKNNLESEVQLLGFVEDVQSFMNAIDIFALTSIWEGFGYVLAEAMYSKKPIVAFDITSNPELIEEGKNGYLIEYPNLEKFSFSLETLINNKNLRDDLGEYGHNQVQKRFSLDEVINEFEKHLNPQY